MLVQLYNLIAFALGIAATSIFGYFLAKYRDEYSKGGYNFMVVGTVFCGVVSLLLAMYMIFVQYCYERCKDEQGTNN